MQQQDVQYHSIKAAEIEQLNQSIQDLQSEKNELLIQMQQKQHEIHNLQNMLTTSMSTWNAQKNALEKNQERLVKEKEDEAEKKQKRLIKETEDYANKEHNRIMAEKNTEMQDISQKYQDLETRFNRMEEIHKQQMGQYKKDVSAEALRGKNYPIFQNC